MWTDLAQAQTPFRYVLPVEVRFRDTDAMGHINHSVYLTYVEMARTAYYERVLWESPEAAQMFLTTPHPQLDNQAPLDLAATDLGTRRVETLLWKLEHSLPV